MMNLFGNLFRFFTGLINWFWKLSLVKKIITAVIIIAVLYFAFTKIFGQGSSTPQYQTATATKGTLISSVSESGQVVASNRVEITTQASGVINHVYVKAGDKVTAGETIADMTLDTDGAKLQAQAYASYISAQNNLNSAKAQLNSLQVTLFKTNQAFVTDRGIANPTDQDKADPVYIEENAAWLQAESNYTNQQGVINQAQAALTSAWLSYQATSATITAPQSGTISDIVITPGLQITSSTNSNSNTVTSQPVASIQTGGAPVISASLSETDVTKVESGQKATITLDAFPDLTFTGIVSGIDTGGVVSSGVTTYPATIVLDVPNDKILPNMSATVNIITSVKDNVLTVPTAAVQSSNGQSTVRVLKNGQITIVPVTTGDTSDTDTEITSGLIEGDVVVVGFVATGQTGSSSSASPFSRSLFGGNAGFGGGGAVIRAGGGGGRGGGG